jgi:uncharacterized protein (TIGR03083 family)
MLMAYESALEQLDAHASAMAAEVRAFGAEDFAANVASCPGWTVRDLVGHLGSVHRWGAEIVRTGERGERLPPPTDPGELAPWFAAGVDDLIAATRAAEPGTDCWTFGPPPHVVDFWVRRQATETAVHHWDALSALSRPAKIDSALGEDGVDEVVTFIFPRQVSHGRIEPLTDVVQLQAAQTNASWTLALDGTQPAGAPQATVTAGAADLFLLLWHRIAPTDPRVTITGDRAAATRVLTAALAP